MIMVKYADLWLIHSHVASLLDSGRLELRELKARSLLLDACTSCPLLRSNLETSAVEIKDFKHKLDHFSRYIVLSPLCEECVSLKGKLFHATKENIELKQEVTYLTAPFEKTKLSEKMIEDNLSQVEESTIKSTYRLGVGFERCEDKGGKSASNLIPSSNYHQEEKTIKSTKAHYPFNPKPSFNPKREVKRETPKPRDEAFCRSKIPRCQEMLIMARKHGNNWIPPVANDWGVTRLVSHKAPLPLQARGGGTAYLENQYPSLR
jgi:hypothetical protein